MIRIIDYHLFISIIRITNINKYAGILDINSIHWYQRIDTYGQYEMLISIIWTVDTNLIIEINNFCLLLLIEKLNYWYRKIRIIDINEYAFNPPPPPPRDRTFIPVEPQARR